MNEQIRRALEEQEGVIVRHHQAMQKMRDEMHRVEQRQKLTVRVVVISVIAIIVVVARLM